LGRIGRHIAAIANAFGMKVLAWSPRLTDAAAREAGAERRELDALLRESDVVSIHATLAQESRGLLDASHLALMKPTAYLINTARGPIVDEAALIAALTQRRVAGAGVAVFDIQPLAGGLDRRADRAEDRRRRARRLRYRAAAGRTRADEVAERRPHAAPGLADRRRLRKLRGSGGRRAPRPPPRPPATG